MGGGTMATALRVDTVGTFRAPPPQLPHVSADGKLYWDTNQWMPIPVESPGDDVAVAQPRWSTPANALAVKAVGVGQDYVPGCPISFARLYEKSYSRIFRTLIPMFIDPVEAEDCVQDAFVRAFTHWASWRPSAPAEAWVMRIAKNGAISQLRKNRIRTVEAILERLGSPKGSENPWDLAADNELRRLIKQLPIKQTEAVTYRFYFGYSGRATSRILGIPERTIASRLWSAKNSLRRKLIEERKACAAI
jgi:RNA polymerase sigma-70 factor, ECF subfamily